MHFIYNLDLTKSISKAYFLFYRVHTVTLITYRVYKLNILLMITFTGHELFNEL